MCESSGDKPPSTPWHNHGAFNDIDRAVAFVGLAVDAIECIGAMLQPTMQAADEQMFGTRQGQAAALFIFIAKAMKPSVAAISNASEKLKMEMRNSEQ